MEFKKMLILLSFTVSIMFGVLIGISYGWYAYSNAESDIKASTLKTAPAVVFSQTEYIENTKIMPIYDEDKYKYGTKNSFTITLGEELKNYETAIEIILNDINISEELKISNYKYELLQNKIVISSGNFSSIQNQTSIKLLPMTIITSDKYPTTYVYELYIWLSDDDSNQNYLMDKYFGAKININSAVKK